MDKAHIDLENRVLRRAVQENLVSFPSQVPAFGKQSRPVLQQKVVVLYFVRGWKMEDIARRYGLGRQRMGQILTSWRIRAMKLGFVQPIEPAHPRHSGSGPAQGTAKSNNSVSCHQPRVGRATLP